MDHLTSFDDLSEMVKNLHANAGDIRDVYLIPGSGRSPGGGCGNPLQCSCLGNSMDRGAWSVHRSKKELDTTEATQACTACTSSLSLSSCTLLSSEPLYLFSFDCKNNFKVLRANDALQRDSKELYLMLGESTRGHTHCWGCSSYLVLRMNFSLVAGIQCFPYS